MKIANMFLEYPFLTFLMGLLASSLVFNVFVFGCRCKRRRAALQNTLTRLKTDYEIFCKLELGGSDNWEDWINWNDKVRTSRCLAIQSLNSGIAWRQSGQSYSVHISACERTFHRPGHLVADGVCYSLDWENNYDQMTCVWLKKVIWFYVQMSLLLISIGEKPELVTLGRFDTKDDFGIIPKSDNVSSMEVLYRDILTTAKNLIESCPMKLKS